MTPPRVLVLKAGVADEALRSAHGDYEDWFRAAIGGRVALEVWPACEGVALPDPAGYDGALITGSPLSVRDEDAWIAAMGRWAVAAAEGGTPVLAVCFGHQIVGEVLGGWVDKNPEGLEVGTISVALTEAGRADPIFAGLPPVITVQSTHSDILARPPTDPRVTLLGGNANTAWQAFSVGEALRAVQFHPEITRDIMRTLMVSREQTHLGRLAASDHGRRILHNWVDGWLLPPGDDPRGGSGAGGAHRPGH